MSHVLVTGAGGYIGSVLVGVLLDRGHDVTGLDRFFFGEEALSDFRKRAGLRLLKKDVRDVVDDDLDGVDAICDLAALSNDPSGDLDPELTRAVNLRARANLAATASRSGVRRYILSSSCSVYGHAGREEVSEATSPAPLSVYAECNARAEEAVLAAGAHGLSVTVLRNPTVFGLSPRMRFDLVLNLMTLQAVRQGRIFVTGGGLQWRPLAHVRDIARTFASILEAPVGSVAGQVFNVAADNLQVRTLAYMVRENLPFPLQVEIVPDDRDKRDYRVSSRKIREIVDLPQRFTVADGVREIYEALKGGLLDDGPQTSTVQWYRTIMDAKRLVDRVELNGRLL
ncbi:MAG TPA: NAD-dependent epimerase/dehydratase family protein [Polyangiaceae bacterium]|nr:NAD-dependent epimerase/dehydratase family protein [Polyangiaceae bacterium]